jgi:hypothetical protein
LELLKNCFEKRKIKCVVVIFGDLVLQIVVIVNFWLSAS